MTRFSRRTFIASAAAAATAQGDDSKLTDVDFRKLISRADLIYDRPVPRSEEGIPIGNGRIGSLVWTSPTQLHLQINRVDVYANDSTTNSFFIRHNDYCGGCAYLDIDFGTLAFPESGFEQHLSVYNGRLNIAAKEVDVRVLAWPSQDVMAIQVDDRRAAREPIRVVLRMLRYESKYFGQKLETFVRDHIVTVENRNHTAASRLLIEYERIVLTQEFREAAFCCKSAVMATVVGSDSKARILNETDIELTASGPSFTVLVASAATFDAQENVLSSASNQLDAAHSKGFTAIARDTEDWWHSFWSRSYVHMNSADGVADFVEQNHNYFLYVMASSSRGKLPPKFNGMIWNTGGDLRTWGAQHWFANLSCYYEALPSTNHFDLMDPMFNMYFGMYDASAVAARQQWGSQGIYIAETSYFNGLERLPDDIASEMQDLYLLRKPWEQRSAKFIEYAQTKHPHSSRWNWIESGAWVNGRWAIKERGFGPYGAVNHIFGSTAKIAYLFWRRYEFTLDPQWLATRAFPMLKGAAEFYRNHPNVKKGADGKYHIDWANSNEGVYGARDTDEDLSAMRGVLAAVLRASEILNVDSELRPAWREFLDNLAPLPLSDDPEALRPENYSGPRVFVRGLKPAVKGTGFLPDGNSLPTWFFDLCNVESSDRARLDIANATLKQSLRNGLNAQTPVSVLSKIPIAAASLGHAEEVRVLIPNQIRAIAPERATAYKNGGVLANRMTLREGPQALDAQRLGRASEALHLAMLQSNPPAPGEDPILHVFPAWPKGWNARYSLLARGAFLVSSSVQSGRVEFVEIESLAGAACRLRNPFEGEVTLYRDGKKSETLRDSLLNFATRKGEKVVAVRPTTKPSDFRRAIP